MFGQKYIIAFALLSTAVPAGCLPFIAASGAAEMRTKASPKNRARNPTSNVELIFVGITAGLAVVLNWAFWYRWKRVVAMQDGEWFGLSVLGAKVVMATAYAMGVMCGLVMSVSVIT
jgi:hypothetical protein